MKRSLVLSALVAALVGFGVRAETPDESYVTIYNLIQEADQLASAGQASAARDKYKLAETGLKQIQKTSPNWNAGVVQFRLNYIAEKVGTSPATISATTSGVNRTEKSDQVKQVVPDERDAQIKTLSEQVQQLENDKRVLDAKLKEALSAQPAAVDPRELTKAEEKIKDLEKEKELLKVSLDQAQTKHVETGSVEELKKALDQTNQKFARQTEVVTALTREKEILETRLKSIQKEDLVKALQAENDMLKKQLAGAKTSTEAPSGKAVKPGGDNSEATIAALQNSLKNLQQEKEALEQTKKELEAKFAAVNVPVAKPGSPEAEQVKLLQQERDELQKKLNETSRQLYDNKARTESIQQSGSDKQVADLKARLEVLETRRIPYTPEELALFKAPALTASKSDGKSGKATAGELPKGAGPLLAEAERAFAARRYSEAEQKYLQVLKLDEKNTFTLSNLAASQLEQNRLDDAEASLQRALAQDPTDAHILSLQGILKFRQEKYDDALDALSRSAIIDPQNAETQNYLGITLSQKGQRSAAEAALRRAVQLAPNYGGAHHNLAVIYATQKPPFIELARYHYQKALAAGHPQNPELEKLIEGGQTAANAK